MGGSRARFYPARSLREELVEDWDGRSLRLAVGELDQVPYAEWRDGGRPLQIFCRWYGFSFSYPGCGLYPD
ncbi:hypothetical protein [Geothermobacter hydrogeniphilus]|uniref:hypothetical protein n=1 Tax=Geothermobacter hydrogeniphilus TaxID=1969733 RepID=UPI0011AFAD44|nr:hypothetical protein [Geothermobacter hydrogeniphilus]